MRSGPQGATVSVMLTVTPRHPGYRAATYEVLCIGRQWEIHETLTGERTVYPAFEQAMAQAVVLATAEAAEFGVGDG